MRLLPSLIDKAHDLGFEVRGGDLFRDPRVHGEHGESGGYGAAYSNHKLKCAIDLNLFKDGVFMEKTEDHQDLGEWWEDRYAGCVWGGYFSNPDGNHYELIE